MSSESETEDGSDTDATRERLEMLEAHVSPTSPPVEERLTAMRARVAEYEQADSGEEAEDALSEVEAELERLRDAVEQELEEGTSKARDLIDDIEAKLSNLR